MPRTLVMALAFGVAVAAACGGGTGTSSGPGSGGQTTAPTAPSAAGLTPAAIASCLRGRGGSVHLRTQGLPTGMRAEISGRLRGAEYDVTVFTTPGAARGALTAMVGMAGGSRMVDGVPIERLMKRAGSILVLYPTEPSASTSAAVESCVGGAARLDPDILASLRTRGCAGASRAAIDEMTDLGPPRGGAWGTPEPVEGGGCVVHFTTSEPTGSVSRLWAAELTLFGWSVSPPRSAGELLHAARGRLGVVFTHEGAHKYALYVAPHQANALEGP